MSDTSVFAKKPRLSLAELRAQTGLVGTSASVERLASSSYAAGIPSGQIVELTGSVKFEWLFHFLAENPSFDVMWIEKHFRMLPPAAVQRGVDPGKIVIAEVPTDLFQHARLAFQSGAFKCLVAPSDFNDERQLMALRVLAKESNTVAFLFSETRTKSWTIGLHLEIHWNTDNESFEILDSLSDEAVSL